MQTDQKQVFFTPSRRRWRIFRSFVLVGVIGFLGLLGFVIYSVHERVFPNLPALQDNETAYRKLTALEQPQSAGTPDGVPRGFHEHKPVHHAATPQKAPIRAGFYVNWDAQSYQTLRDHVEQMNMVMPEWLFVNNSGQLSTDIDAQADSLLKAHPGVAVVPMISNFFNQDWRGKNVHKLLISPARRQIFIRQVVGVLAKYHFQGVNIDFEELNEPSDESLTTFMRELHAVLHPKGYLVTIDVGVLNPDYNLPKLKSCVDYIMLMAYDEHFSTSAPGPVAPYPWIEYTLEETCKGIPSEQVVLCVAGYGYDWAKGGEGVDITYQQAMARANRKSATPVTFDNQTYSLTYRYADDAGKPHTVWFNDAASAYNVMRAASDYETAGVAVWRLGSEDSRMWSYFARDLSMPSLQKKPVSWQQLQQVPVMTSVDFQGEGDILDVQATPRAGTIQIEYDLVDQLITEEKYVTLPTSYVVRKVGKAEKTMSLSFDDGPDETYTPQILDILEREHVPASFFVVGVNAERNLPLLQRMAKTGYEIGNHTTLHPDLARVSPNRLFIELNTCRRIIESITGRSTILFRPPYNADSEPGTSSELLPIALAKNQHYYTIGESIDPLDWQADVTPAQILQRIQQQQDLGNIILLHDAGGNRSATVKALPAIIHYYKQHGYHFASLSELMHRPKSELMPAAPVQQAILLTDRGLADLIYYGMNGLSWLFLVGTVLAIGRVLLLAVLAIRERSTARTATRPTPCTEPVSVIVPGYNEEVNAIKTVESLLDSTYDDLQVIFVDDGSTDNTYAVMQARFQSDHRVQVLTKANGGKASALNYGLLHTTSPVVVCIDADTLLLPDAIGRLVAPFANDDSVGAVAGNVRVGNAHNWLTRFQSIEYTTSQNFDRRAYDVLNCITVVPGAIGAFRLSAMAEVGYFTTDTLAEDCDLTIRIRRAGYRVTAVNEAIAITEAPETVSMLLKQRIRWCYGIMQTIYKHHDLLFRRGAGAMGWLALPSLVIFQFGFPLLTLVAEMQLLLSFLTGSWSLVLAYFVGFLLVDAAVATLAYRLEGRPLRDLVWLFPQRIVWRYLLFWVLLCAYGNAIRGELATWGFLKRSGSVQLQPENARA